MVTICFSLMVNSVEHLFMCLGVIPTSSFVKCVFKAFAYLVCCWAVIIFCGYTGGGGVVYSR